MIVPVHPRACGERPVGGPHGDEVVGSSPRLRGTQALQRDFVRVLRFIPAPAGNASQYRTFKGRPPVHPRACGERRP